MLDSVYKLRYATKQRRHWEAAAALKGEKLAEWLRRSLDEAADWDISHRGQ